MNKQLRLWASKYLDAKNVKALLFVATLAMMAMAGGAPAAGGGNGAGWP
ncbi:MAG: hypothetical protein GX605_11755 [Chloroflexi bacterium]|nr:hypothetical protein [Chloroflexota bacterium]